jgi:hypothetical protein
MAPGGCVLEQYGTVLVLVYYTVQTRMRAFFFHASIGQGIDVIKEPTYLLLFRLFRRLFTTRLSIIHPSVHDPVLLHLLVFVGWEKKKILEKKGGVASPRDRPFGPTTAHP